MRCSSLGERAPVVITLLHSFFLTSSIVLLHVPGVSYVTKQLPSCAYNIMIGITADCRRKGGFPHCQSLFCFCTLRIQFDSLKWCRMLVGYSFDSNASLVLTNDSAPPLVVDLTAKYSTREEERCHRCWIETRLPCNCQRSAISKSASPMQSLCLVIHVSSR